MKYPPVSSNMGRWTIEMGDFPTKTSIQFGDFPASHVWWNRRVPRIEAIVVVKPFSPKHTFDTTWALPRIPDITWSSHAKPCGYSCWYIFLGWCSQIVCVFFLCVCVCLSLSLRCTLVYPKEKRKKQLSICINDEVTRWQCMWIHHMHESQLTGLDVEHLLSQVSVQDVSVGSSTWL